MSEKLVETIIRILMAQQTTNCGILKTNI